MSVVAIIPARGGSKGVPRKNLKELCGKPLIAHIIETALQVEGLDRVIVSTEDEQIARVADKYGAEVPFIRPAELAQDETPTLPVLQHAVHHLETEERYPVSTVVLLYATSPLLPSSRISEAITMMKTGHYDSVISVVHDRGHYWTENSQGFERLYPTERDMANRQFVKPLLKENGAIYVQTRDLLIEQSRIVGDKIGMLLMEENESIDIDEPFDFELAKCIMQIRSNGS